MRSVEFTYQKLSVETVDLEDDTFRISLSDDLRGLKDSIEKVGIIHPPILQETSQNHYRIICGFKRVACFRELGYHRIIAAVLPEGVSESDVFLLSLHENLFQRNLNPVEIAIVISKLRRYFSPLEIERQFLPLLGMGKSSSLLGMYESIMELEEEIKRGLVTGVVSKEAAPLLLRFESRERISLYHLIARLQLSKSKQVEVIENLSIIRERDRVSLDTVLTSEEVEEILSDRRMGLVNQGDRIRDYLRRLRYPQLTKADEDFMKKKNSLGLKGIALIPPAYFEGDEFRISFSFSSVREFNKRLETLQSVADKGEFKEIVEG
jgi:hypothetical protein